MVQVLTNNHRTDHILSLVEKMVSTEVCDLNIVNFKSEVFKSLEAAGVYLLLKNNEVVYVGQSMRPEWRIPEHARGSFSKDFDSFYIVRCEPENLDNLEALLILHYQPPYNSKVLQNRSSLLMSTRQVSALLAQYGASKRLLNRWVKDGLVSPIGTYGKFDYYLSSEIAALVAKKLKP